MLTPLRPEIITTDIEVHLFHKKINVNDAIGQLLDGQYVLVADYFSSGLKLLHSLRKRLQKLHSQYDFESQRMYRAAYREASHRLLLEISDHQIKIKKSPFIGWLELLYPDTPDFFISFPSIQGLNSAWQWYTKGLTIEKLNLTIHPYYGVYFPTRFDHLVLLDEWLSQYQGKRDIAYDIGTGSGILSLLLQRHKFNSVIATDSNPNAIIGLVETLETLDLTQITPRHGDLFAGSDDLADLIVFNPPWLKAQHELSEGIDRAIYYDDDLFERFFEQAPRHLRSDGRVVLLFSNLSKVVDSDTDHPIRSELKRDRFVKQELIVGEVAPASRNTRRKDNRKDEQVELWILRLK
ncbi:MAG: methyltransferase [Candidatus Kariarchaeaceae archaeon]